MKVALIGLPQSGKSTVFTAVTGLIQEAYAARAIRHGVVKVPERRLDYLAELYNPKKIVEAQIEFMDVPGCSWDDANGRDEWRKLLPTIRQAECLIAVVRDFENPSVPAYKNRVDARADFDVIRDEFIFSDLEAVATRVDRLEATLKKPSKTQDSDKKELALLVRCHEALEGNKPLSTVLNTDEERRQLASFGFLTEMPLICVRNTSDDKKISDESWTVEHVHATVTLNGSIEADIAQLDPADRPAFLADLGIKSPASDRLIRSAYRACGLISFLTMGPDECRAWTVREGSSAVEAAGKIHSDLARGFVRAETVAYDDLVANKDMKGAKAAGKVRKEGKTYIVVDGDIMNILAST